MRARLIIVCVLGLLLNSVGASFTYAVSKHRQDRVLDAEPYRVLKGLSLVQCLTVCFGQERCESFNFGSSECHLLDTFLCKGDPDRKLTDRPGFSYYDTMDFLNSEEKRMMVRACNEYGRCSTRCPKFRLMSDKKPMSESQTLCEGHGGFLAQPASLDDHRQITRIVQTAKVKSAWIGVLKVKNASDTNFAYSDSGPGQQGPVTGELWGDEQPNNTGGKQDCVEMLSDMKFKWNDVECDKKNPAVCQFSA